MKNLIIASVVFSLLITNCTDNKKLDGANNQDAEETYQLIIAQDNYISELSNYGANIEELSEAQKIFYFNQNLEREVNNGGFRQYFYNSSGDFSHETINALKEIGATKTASILQKAIDQFPNKLVPSNREERINTIKKIEDIASNIWNELENDFYNYEDDLNALNYEFIKKNKKHFNIAK